MKIYIALLLIIPIFAVMSGCSEKNRENMLVTDCIDVGKGDCILLRHGKKTLMIDTGYAETADKVLAYLHSNGIGKLDYMIITHYDKDHVGGAAGIVKNIDTENILLPAYEGESEYYTELMQAIKEKGITAQQVRQNTDIALDNINVKVIASDVEYIPSDGKKEGNDNDVSLLVSVFYGSDKYLFAGDMEKDGIESFLSKDDTVYDVVKMPHHGKKEKNTDEFIEKTKPQIAVITDSAEEPADDKTLELLGGCDVYRTSTNGSIKITSGGDGNYKVKTQS